MQERRKQPRKDLMSYSQVFDLNEGYLIGYLGDLNSFGAMVISDVELKAEKELIIQIQLPELENFSDETLTVPVRVVWCQQDLSPEYYNVGLEFKKLTSKQQQIIDAILENYEFRRQKPNYPPHPNELNISE
ncbi:MAG TPA: PilZ domain-containing protein [Anaerolineales bacterium]|nr:PilZ domain-containing protein [Anaerolineales bacterium]